MVSRGSSGESPPGRPLAGPIIYSLCQILPGCSLFCPPLILPDRSAVLVQCEENGQTGTVTLAAIPSTHVDLVVLPEYAYLLRYRHCLTSKQGPVALAKTAGLPGGLRHGRGFLWRAHRNSKTWRPSSMAKVTPCRNVSKTATCPPHGGWADPVIAVLDFLFRRSNT